MYSSSTQHERWNLHHMLREWRHNPCLMQPLSAFIVVILSLVSIVMMILRLPSALIGFLLIAPFTKRGSWLVEFLYPLSIAKWGHLLLIRYSMRKTNGASHSRALEQRFEVVKRRVYIHTIPLFVDNLAYLIVNCPSRNEPISVHAPAILIDCGDAFAVMEAVEKIQDNHYNGRRIQIVAILSTHKHHDHTAGNRDFVNHQRELGHEIKVFGGLIEKIPMCTDFVRNGEIIALPVLGDIDINRYIEIEAISVPSHTRGSIVYRLSTQNPNRSNHSPVNHLFTGDAMFSAGGGQPFEADVDFDRDNSAKLERRKAHHHIHPSAGTYSIERCFAEILVRCSSSYNDLQPDIIIYPGHDYTSELLQRQLTPSNGNMSDWHKLPPADFFDVASHYFISQHRRTLPSGAKLLTVPSCLSRELVINPHFRSLRKQGKFLISALKVWYKHLCRRKLDTLDPGLHFQNYHEKSIDAKRNKINDVKKSESTMNTWNLTHSDISRPTFTTVYSNDLESIIEDLRSNRINKKNAADRLSELSSKLKLATTSRRPIPNSLPPEKSIWLGCLAFAILGSGPCGMTRSDALKMNVPPPVRESDRIKISRKRLLMVLMRLGVLDGLDSNEAKLISLLWREASEDDAQEADIEQSPRGSKEKKTKNNYESVFGHESKGSIPDEIELGYLKLELYGVATNQYSKSRSCIPCSSSPTEAYSSQGDQDIVRNRKLETMKRTSAELLRHEVELCAMCKNSVGCPILDDMSDFENMAPEEGIEMVTEEERSFSGIESLVLDAASASSSQNSCFDDNLTSGGEMEVIIVNGNGIY